MSPAPTHRGRYAADTEVASEQTRLDLERTLRRYGADQFMSGYGRDQAVIGFRLRGRMFRIIAAMPNPDDRAFTHRFVNQSDAQLERHPKDVARLYEQAIRQRWRALLLVVKAQLEAVEVGIFSIEDVFVGHTLLPNGQTVREWVEPQVDHAYKTAQMPNSLPGFPSPQPSPHRSPAALGKGKGNGR